MALEIVRNINVDFHDTEYIMVNAKQYDDKSRYVKITCYDQGKAYSLSANKHSAYVKFKKADGNPVLNFCKIDYRGDVLVELTEQMLSSDGICYADLVVIDKGRAVVNIDTGDIIAIDDTSVLSTMAFCVNVYETSVDNSEFESSYEFNALNNLLVRAEADYMEVVTTAKSYTKGGTGIRDGEDTDNAKYYCEQSAISAENAAISEDNAAISEKNAKTSETNAAKSESAVRALAESAAVSEKNAKASETNAKVSETNAKASETNAKTYETNAKVSETNAKTYETNAAISASNAAISEANAKTSETNAKTSEENASNYCEIVKSVANGLNSGFIPIGTIAFAELATAEKATGFTYNISDDFITDSTFREGSGKSYTAGTNVYYTYDGFWDCFGGSASPTATVDEVRAYLGI